MKKNWEEGFAIRPEILAPAGSMEALRAAILAGADAVYVGGTAFGARAYADNLDKDALLEAIAYVHRQRKRLYLTVNTLVKEQEFGALYEFLAPFYAAGLDAVIVQDVGVVRHLAKYFPTLPIHASTQMTLTCANGADFLEGYPVTRLVPARELSLAEIGELCEKSRLEVEIFVHGAYCYCYSGQCLMSSMIGGRSGNRGRCAQPCRMEYKTEDGRAGYFLSPKDLCGLTILPELIETGAASFKIEGRMKRPEYAAAVSAAYREGVEAYFRMGKEGYRAYLAENPDFLEKKVTELADVYNRGGFTTGCFQRKNGPELMSVRRPGHFGTEVGTVLADSVGKAEFVVTKEVFAQDVLELRTKSGAREGIPAYYKFTLGEGAEAGEIISARMPARLTAKKGDLVYRMKNAALLEEIADQCMQEGKIAVDGIFTAKSGEVCTLTLCAEAEGLLPPRPMKGREETKPVAVCVDGFVCEKAEKLPATEEGVKRQLLKTGNEEFVFTSLLVALADDVFLPNGKLNELRRKAFAKLKEEIQEGFIRTDLVPWDGKTSEEDLRRQEAEVSAGGAVLKRQEAETTVCGAACERQEESQEALAIPVDCVVLTKEQAAVAGAAAGIRRIYADFGEYPEKEILEELEKLKGYRKEVFFVLPRICRQATQERLKKELGRILPLVDGFLLRNYESLALLREILEKSAIEGKTRDACMENSHGGEAGLENNYAAEGRSKKLVLDANLYVMNRSAKEFYREYFGTIPYELTAPYELSERELLELGIADLTMVVYGRILLMVSTHCVRKTTAACAKGEEKNWLYLTDRVGKRLPVRCFCKDCINVIYNPEILWLMGEKAVERLRPRALRLDFTTEDAQETARVLEAVGTGRTLEGSFTRGHLKRGVE